MNWLKSLFGLGEIAGEYLKERQRLKGELRLAKLNGKIDLEKAKFQAKVEQQRHISTWEQMYVNMQATSWKDEAVLFVLLAPYVGAFVPEVQDYVLVGFQYLDQMPAWAVGLTVAIFLAIYGIRHRNANKIQAPGLRDRDVEAKPNGQD